MKTNLVLYNNDDWVGLYSNGKLLDEGHSISLDQFCHYVGIELTRRTADDEWLTERGGFPDNIEDVKV